MSIFIIILIILIICWPWISPWLMRHIRNFVARHIENTIRRSMGVPPPPKQKRRRRWSRKDEPEIHDDGTSRQSDYGEPPHGKPADMMKQVAEDVKFVEIKEFEETTIGDTPRETPYYREEQVSDAEFIEIKDK
ncbi:MAG: hypothetical protein ACI304_03460 [Lepagella sp.]